MPDMLCRFENRLAGQALALEDYRQRIDAAAPAELEDAFAQIDAAHTAGCWVALLLDYELGAWLEPSAAAPDRSNSPAPRDARPRLTALVIGQARQEAVWQAPAADTPLQLRARALLGRNCYMANVQALREAIGRGELYQANYTFRIALETGMPPQALYRCLAARNPAAHSAYIEDGSRTILSFSPELFFARHGSQLTVRPMKGTAPRHPDPQQDRALGEQLLQSEKNRAENLMIVDLLRNDLGRLATPGSVKVDALFSLEQYPSVWTLTSTVSAQAPGASLQALLRALFPCGSITGAPKIAAMRRIQALETGSRGIYCGSVGWLAPNGDCSLNVAIRTVEMHQPGQGVFGVGGGIVHDSDPAQEWEECLWKARILGADPGAPAPVAWSP